MKARHIYAGVVHPDLKAGTLADIQFTHRTWFWKAILVHPVTFHSLGVRLVCPIRMRIIS